MIEELRIGNWMQTYTGLAFYPLDPRPEEIDPRDIAHALSLICRFGGHTKRFYSVAEHCVLMSRAVSPENALWALLHDATEAYVGDMVRPLKLMMPHYVAVEDVLMSVICRRFELQPIFPAEVKDADSRILLNEKEALMSQAPAPWAVDTLEPLPVEIRGWSPDLAEVKYLQRFEELTGVAS